MSKIKKGVGKPKHHIRSPLPADIILYHRESVLKLLSGFLDEVRTHVFKGDFKIVVGRYKGRDVGIVNTGMGAGTTAMVVEQAGHLGVKRIFKMGTFGALQKDIDIADILLVDSAVRSEGLTDAYAPMYYPAVPDFELTKSLAQTLEDSQTPYRTGTVHSVNIYSKYYEDMFNKEKYDPYIYKNLGVAGVEMETSTVFVCSKALGVKSAALLVCNRLWSTQEAYIQGKEVQWENDPDKKERAILNCARSILETIVKT